MKKSINKIIALLAVAAIVFSFAACGGKTDSGSLMQNLFNTLKESKRYADWKAIYVSTTFDESFADDVITLSAKGEEGLDGDYAFSLDGDYVVTSAPEDDYAAYTFAMEMKDIVAEYYDASGDVYSGYIAGLQMEGKETKYFIVDSADGKNTFKVFATSAWDLEGIDEMVVDENELEYVEPLTDEQTNYTINCGKIRAVYFGNNEKLELIVSEYGKNTELTLKSIQNIVAKLQPKGYEDFAKNFTELKDIEADDYTVSLDIPESVAQAHEYTTPEGYSTVTVVFGA